MNVSMEGVSGRHLQRIEGRISHEPNSGCWLWAGTVTPAGYGQITLRKQNFGAHRLVYQLHGGVIPEGLQLDHKCKVRCCVNPEHLEPVTMRENILRGDGPFAINKRKTHCKRGHEFAPPNVRIKKGKFRACIACERLRHKGLI